MLQRVQTIYLLLAIVCDALMFAFPFAKFTIVQDYIFSLNSPIVDGKLLAPLPYTAMVIVLSIFTFICISLFKNRPLQLRLGRLNYILHLGFIVSVFFSVDTILTKIPNGNIAEVAYGIGFYLPVAALAFLFLANRSIKKDEEIVRSLDRLRS